jgi:hypothetical protein
LTGSSSGAVGRGYVLETDIFLFGGSLRPHNIMVLSCCLLKLYAGVILRGSEEVLSSIGALGSVPVLASAHIALAPLISCRSLTLRSLLCWFTSLKLSGFLHDTRLRMSSLWIHFVFLRSFSRPQLVEFGVSSKLYRQYGPLAMISDIVAQCTPIMWFRSSVNPASMHVITSTFFTLNDSYMPGYAVMRAQVSALYHSPGQQPQRGCRSSPCGDAGKPLSAFGEARFACRRCHLCCTVRSWRHSEAFNATLEPFFCDSDLLGIEFDWGVSEV